MAPPSADIDTSPQDLPSGPAVTKDSSQSRLTEPLVYSGSLDEFKQFDVTSNIGREFPDLQVSTLLNDDEKLRDLGILGQSSLGSLEK